MATIIEGISDRVKNWWIYLVYGVLLLGFSFWILSTPGSSYLGLTFVFSIMVFVNGASSIFFAFSNRNYLEGWGWHLAGGILELIIGVVLLTHPTISIVTLPLIIGFWLFMRASFVIGTSFDLKRFGLPNWGWLLVLGVLLSLLALMMILNPVFGAMTLITWTAVAFMVFGANYIFFSLQLKKVKNETLDKPEEFKDKVVGGVDMFLDSVKVEMEKAGEDTTAFNEDSAMFKKEIANKLDKYLQTSSK